MKAFFAVAFFLALLFWTGPNAWAQEEAKAPDGARQHFTLVNATGMTIDELYLSEVSTDEWEEDILGVDSLEDGKSVVVNFPREEDECAWDMMIINSDGEAYYWRKIDLCKYTKITLHFKDGKAWATFE